MRTTKRIVQAVGLGAVKVDIIRQLAQLEDWPAVSIMSPLDPLRPGNPHDPAVLATLRERAVERIHAVVHGHDADTLIARIDEALGSIDLRHPSPAVAVLVSPTTSRVIELQVPVEPDVVVGKRFAIRDLIAALSHSRHARVLVLSQATTRCIDLSDDEIVEHVDFGFPVVVEAPTEADTPHRDFPLDEHEHAEAARFVLRAVDRALGELERHDLRPLVFVGTERDLAYARDTIHPRAPVIGFALGNYERDTPEQLAQLVRPVLDERAREDRESACTEAREANGARAVSGIAETWIAARAGRGRRLLIESGYHVAATVGDGRHLELASPGAPGTFDAVSDAVEEVVRHGGDVVVVADGDLQDLGRVALLTRY